MESKYGKLKRQLVIVISQNCKVIFNPSTLRPIGRPLGIAEAACSYDHKKQIAILPPCLWKRRPSFLYLGLIGLALWNQGKPSTSKGPEQVLGSTRKWIWTQCSQMDLVGTLLLIGPSNQWQTAPTSKISMRSANPAQPKGRQDDEQMFGTGNAAISSRSLIPQTFRLCPEWSSDSSDCLQAHAPDQVDWKHPKTIRYN